MSPSNFWQVASSVIILLAHSTAGGAQANITDDAFFYGQSPPVYPAPPMPGKGPWAVAYSKAVSFVSQMTLAEKANITVGYPPTTGCSGETGTVPRLNWTGICLSDAGNGLRNTDFVNSWPSGLHVGASWNRALVLQRARHMGAEFRRKGVHVALGPVVRPLGRVDEAGRNWEGMGSDPYLSGKLAAETISGIQEVGVTASVKHYIGYEQETNRNPAGNVSSVSANIDDKTMHELHLWPFADAVQAGAGCVMCSYNRINNSYACQNSKSLNGLLKTELGFEGFVVTDWGGQHAGISSAEAGLDVAMPNSPFWGVSGEILLKAIKNGSIAESRVTDMATRLVASWYQMRQDYEFPPLGIGMSKDYTLPHRRIDARDLSSQSVLLNGAMEGHVLVKNVNRTLPLKKPKLLSVFGYDAVAPPAMDVMPDTDLLSPFSYGFEPELVSDPLISAPPYTQIAPNGTMISGGGSGANAPAYDFTSFAPSIDTSSDACLVFINAFATEGADRSGLHDDFSDGLVLNVANACSNTIVVIHNAGIRLVDQWIEHPNVTALIFAHLPGQDSGRALVKLLYSAHSPSGKLPYTVAKNETDYTTLAPSLPLGQYAFFPQSDFTEGTYIDYRSFDARNISPRYEFGFGLTYTTFAYFDLEVEILPGASTSYLPPASAVIEGGFASLWDNVARVHATISNAGNVDAMEVTQLYVGIPGGPVRQLRGFNKVEVPVGTNVTVKFDLMRRDLSEWNVQEQSWVLQEGCYGIWVGSSSRHLPLVGTLNVAS